jgi:hypothetical protein
MRARGVSKTTSETTWSKVPRRESDRCPSGGRPWECQRRDIGALETPLRQSYACLDLVMAELPTGTVTPIFTNIEGSTKLLEEIGERCADVLVGHRRGKPLNLSASTKTGFSPRCRRAKLLP